MTIKRAPFTRTAALKRAKAARGKSYPAGWCQAFTVGIFGTGGVGDYDGDGAADAEDGWAKAKRNGKVVPASKIKNLNDIPAGYMLYWSGGTRRFRNGRWITFGHAAVSAGKGKTITTDLPTHGKVGTYGISALTKRWGMKFLGYVIVEGNGHDLRDAPKPAKIRGVQWNVALKTPRHDTKKRVARQVKRLDAWRLDYAAFQECPSSGDGKLLLDKMGGIGLTKRVGSHGRYIVFRGSVTTVHGWTSRVFGGKRGTIACATIRGHKKVIFNGHPISGSTAKAKLAREQYAKYMIRETLEYAEKHDVTEKDVIFLGDFNGGEFAAVARNFGFGRMRTYAKSRTVATRTYNAWGKRSRNLAGGQLDYGLAHLSVLRGKKILKQRNFYTYKAADHNAVFYEIQE